MEPIQEESESELLALLPVLKSFSPSERAVSLFRTLLSQGKLASFWEGERRSAFFGVPEKGKILLLARRERADLISLFRLLLFRQGKVSVSVPSLDKEATDVLPSLFFTKTSEAEGFSVYEASLDPEEALLLFFQSDHRDFPWRQKEATPYDILLSETMLEQTRTETVVPYFERFKKDYPDFSSLARAEESDVLKHWEGLGYYSRARNLHRLAKAVETEYQGRLPSDESSLLSLPGVGPYVAHAVLSIAFKKPYVAVDGNLVRIYARLTESPLEKNSTLIRKEAESFFRNWISKEEPGASNQGLMGVGQQVCLPHGAPLCSLCPLQTFCRSRKDRTMLLYPKAPEKKEKRKEERTLLLLRDGEKVVLSQRSNRGLLASAYEFPSLPGRYSLPRLRKALLEEGISFLSVERLGSYEHVFSHLVWSFQVYEIRLSSPVRKEGWFLATKEELQDRYFLPTAFKKALELLPEK